MSDMADGPGLVERAAMRLRREQGGAGPRAALPLPDAEPGRPARESDATPRAAGATADLARSWSGRSRQEEVDFARLRDAGMVTPDTEWSEVAEQFRIVKRPILLRAFDAAATRHPNANVVMVTSARPGEGKTFTACNLALSIAREQDYSVLLVDADIRRPSVARVLGLGDGPGLTDLLDDPAIDPGDAMIRVANLRNLAVIPSGRPDHRAPELFASQRMSRLVQSFAARYRDRIVVIDTPPALATSEPSVISLCAGQALLVVEADRTRASAIRSALALIGRCPSISLLLNKTRPSLARDEFGPGGYGYGYGYGSGQGGGRGKGASPRGKDAGVQ